LIDRLFAIGFETLRSRCA